MMKNETYDPDAQYAADWALDQIKKALMVNA